jgi:UDP-N-acetylglucosamine--N-acetylmuramyl-(pentapeptide) pyrophosphoryl-undecaprenol N-acetylglucosamine transferase
LAIAGGGTGGHLVPGVHLCTRALSRHDERPTLSDVLWLTSGRSVEERVLARLDEKLSLVAWERVVLPLERAGGGAPSRPELLLWTAPAVVRARRALARHDSQVLLGIGGYTCLPAVLAARSLGIPVALLEMNAAAGSATRWLAPFARTVLHAWKGSLPSGAERNGTRHVHVGPPLAPEFDGREIPAAEEAGARAELGLDPDRPLLLVLGGSQGASPINRFVRMHAPAIVAAGISVLHQTGPGKMGEGCEPFSGYRAVEYLAPMHRALAAATLVLTRGGASTLAEIAALGRPALVVPYPHHADRHQERNAAELGEGVRVVPEERLSGSLREEIENLCSDAGRPQRELMGRALRAAVPADGAERLLAILGSLASNRAESAEGARA